MKQTRLILLCSACIALLNIATATKLVAYIHGDISENGTIPSGTELVPYDQMLLSDSGNTGCSQFKAMVEAEGYTISQHYDQTTILNAAFLNPLDVIVFGLHQKVWSLAEKESLDEWIRNGGGILMYSDSAAGGKYNVVGITNAIGQTAVNNILSQYGMEVTVDQGGGTRSYRPDGNSSNPILWDQPVFEGEGVSPVAIDTNSGAVALIPLDDEHNVAESKSIFPIDARHITISSPTWAVIGHQQAGHGHIIAIFDRQPIWNNGPGSDINEEDNKEVLRRIIRFLARDYGNSSDWINLVSTNALELTYRQWRGGTGTPGYDYTSRNTRFEIQQKTNLVDGTWGSDSNQTQFVSITPETGETEMTTVRLLPMPGNQAGFSRVALLPATNAAPDSVLAINCGGDAYTGNNGVNYAADIYFTGGHIDDFPGNDVANTTDDALYNYARSGHTAYTIPVTNGSYSVTLQFAETYFGSANKRKFSVSIEGHSVIQNLDLYATAPGKWVAYDLTFPVTVADGDISLSFTASINNALINAIVVAPNQL
ncbi:malectin [Pontiellaceae bacterium B12227]|nr:malectin [Pontiellaceae bacterium B12227]